MLLPVSKIVVSVSARKIQSDIREMSWIRRVGFAGVLMALILLLMACGGSVGTSSTHGSASATMPASGNMAPEWPVVNGQYSDQRFIDMMVPHHMMAV